MTNAWRKMCKALMAASSTTSLSLSCTGIRNVFTCIGIPKHTDVLDRKSFFGRLPHLPDCLTPWFANVLLDKLKAWFIRLPFFLALGNSSQAKYQCVVPTSAATLRLSDTLACQFSRASDGAMLPRQDVRTDAKLPSADRCARVSA